MHNEFDDIPLSQSNVSLKLAEVQRRCSKLIDDPDYLGGLSLEDAVAEPDDSNPYNRG